MPETDSQSVHRVDRLKGPDNTVSRYVAERIRHHRQRRGWTMEQLAQRSGLKLRLWERWSAAPTGSTSSRCSASCSVQERCRELVQQSQVILSRQVRLSPVTMLRKLRVSFSFKSE